MRWPLLVLFCTTALALSGSDAGLYETANAKIEQIRNDEAAAGSTTTITVDEVNALVRGKIKEEGIEGVREPKITLGTDKGTWSGLVDFEKLPQLESLRSNFLLSSILKGEKPISATVLLKSADGRATIDVEQVSIGETRFEGRTLGFLVEKVVLGDFPDAKLGEPFELEHNVERIELRPDGVRVKIKD